MPSAGDVEQFAYCAHNWWLARRGVDPHDAGSARGMRTHAEMGQAQRASDADLREHRFSLMAALSVIMLGMAGVLAAIALRVRGTQAEVIALSVVALVLGLGSATLLTLSLFARRDHLRRARAANLVAGRIVASDLAGEAPLLSDPEWGLRGRADYILQTRDGPVPVEVKTGRTPERPHRSHQLQLACYLRLLEATGPRPAYGLVSYPEGVFRVAWDAPLREELRATVERIRAAERAGRADRDHDQPARCRGCARRDACEQRLA